MISQIEKIEERFQELEKLLANPTIASDHKRYVALSKEYKEKEAIVKLEELFKTKDVIIMVGGSGLYSNAVVNGIDDFPDIPKTIREELNLRLKTEGFKVLQSQLKALDTISFNTIAIDNPQRLIRALEICIGTGKPYSSFLSKNRVTRPFKTISIGVKAEREIIYERINRRVDIMVESGLVTEAKSLLPHKHLNALNTVGYKELFKYLEGKWTLEFAISEIKKNTRRFAKRQLTWYRKDESIMWFDYLEDVNQIISYIENKKTSI